MSRTIRINDDVVKHRIAWTLILLPCVAVYLLAIEMWDLEAQDWYLLLLPGIFAGGALYFAFLYAFRLAFWVELGPEYSFRTLFRERSVPWEQVARFVLSSPGTPITGMTTIKVMLTDGTRLRIWAWNDEAELALEAVRAKPWAKDWEGRPAELCVALFAFFLGLFILVVGIYIDFCLLWVWMWEGNPHPGVGNLPTVSIGLPFLVEAVVSPLVGALGLIFGIYHLFWRPRFYTPKVGFMDDKTWPGFWNRIARPD